MTHTLTITFNLTLPPNKIYDFRGAFISMAANSGISDKDISWISNEEYENGNWGNAIDQYPRVQYRVNQGELQIWAVNEGRKAIERLVNKKNLQHFTLQNKLTPLQIIKIEKESFTIHKDTDMHSYLLFHYVPCDEVKEKIYHQMGTMVEKVQYLEQLISKGIYNALLSLSVPNIGDIGSKVTLVDIIKKDKAIYKTKDKKSKKPILKHPLSYFIKFKSDILLPNGFAVGNYKSQGYGAMYKIEDL
ncbi:MAG: hypothetical protein WAT37_11665 [Saprospiraceae bacterium]